ncbi:MAG: hypothetical protein E7Z81_02515 [Methanobrevibacter sp.]|jgi:hypothetical protein|uniref:hypothetical protein n=1 Tax=Methanobrevibacter sp. TaxID=66852 RepID=UPI0025F214DD|nr:hypothetical protein [Methanobrevibacter sp.]MBE6497146.1 hypothetical protein [Methanobrevibacter sp.]
MSKVKVILAIIVVILIALLLFTITSPILIIAEDTTEGSPGIDMAAKFTALGGFDWIYPGSSVNANGQTLHNVHQDSPDDPYGAARDIMEYSYQFSPHLIISVNPEAAEGIFGAGLIDNIRANDAYNGYSGSENVQGTMSRGDAVDTAMNSGTFNPIAIPTNILMGNIKFIFV